MHVKLLALIALPFLPQAFANIQEYQIPFPMSTEGKYVPETNTKPTLTDLLTIESAASIFFSYAREIELSRIFSDTRMNTTVLVPTNKAVMALARKPHQGPVISDEGIEISDQEFDERSRQNVERWVSAHIIPESPIQLESRTYPTLLHKKTVTFTPIAKSDPHAPEWTRVTLENGVHITHMAEGLNGVIYLLDGTVSDKQFD